MIKGSCEPAHGCIGLIEVSCINKLFKKIERVSNIEVHFATSLHNYVIHELKMVLQKVRIIKVTFYVHVNVYVHPFFQKMNLIL